MRGTGTHRSSLGAWAVMLLALVVMLGMATPRLALARTDLVPTTLTPQAKGLVEDDRGGTYTLLQAAIDAAGTRPTTITINQYGKNTRLGPVKVKSGQNITIKTGEGAARINEAVEVTGGSLKLIGTKSYPISVSNLMTCTGSPTVQLERTYLYFPFRQEGGTLTLKDSEIHAQFPFTNMLGTCYLKGVSMSMEGGRVAGCIYAAGGTTISRLKNVKVLSSGQSATKHGVMVTQGSKLLEVTGCTIEANGSAIYLEDGATGPALENNYLIARSGPAIRASILGSGVKIEPSLSTSKLTFGPSRYADNEKSVAPLWIDSSVMPAGYALSRWASTLRYSDFNGKDAYVRARYVVYTECSVTYDANGGTGDMSAYNRTHLYGDEHVTTEKNRFTNGGRDSCGWNTKPDGSGIPYVTGSTIDFNGNPNVVLYVQWMSSYYDVTIKTNGGSYVPNQRVRENDRARILHNPMKDGYEFVEWCEDEELTKPYDFSKPVTKNITLYAKYKPITRRVTFNSNGGTAVETQNVNVGAQATKPTDPTRPHYEFGGWFADSELTKPYDFSQAVKVDTTLYAKWVNFNECHVWNASVTQEGTCTQDEITTYTCTLDPSHTYTDVTHKATGHVWYDDDHLEREEPATCTTEGRLYYTTKTCAICHARMGSKTAITLPKHHAWSAWETITPATETTEGLQRRHCTREGCTATDQRTIPVLPHTHSLHLVEAEESTCTDEGHIAYWYCDGCDRWFYEENAANEIEDKYGLETEGGIFLPKKNHELGAKQIQNVVPSTCTTMGCHDEVYYCTVCGTEVERGVISDDLAPHTAGTPRKVDGVEPTCEASGFHHMVTECSTCGALLDGEFVEDAALGHSWDGGRIGVPATCTTPGFTLFYCIRNPNHVKMESIEATGHTADTPVWENVHPSDGCTDHAIHDEVTYCKTCGAELSRETVDEGAPGHIEGAEVTGEYEPTCTEEGLRTTTRCCEECGDVLHRTQETIAALGHAAGTPTREDEVAATCTSDGSYDLVTRCTRSICGEELSRKHVTVRATGHDWSAWEQVTAPTEESEGQDRHTCSKCGQTEARTTPRLVHKHTLIHSAAVPATCEHAGIIEYWACTGCDRQFFDEAGTQEIMDVDDLFEDALPHTPGAATRENVVASTCSEEGSHDDVVRCTACNAELSRTHVVDPLAPHDPDHMTTEVREQSEPTCEKSGHTYEVTYCQDCMEELAYSETFTPALGHVHGEPITENLTEPTCTEGGSYDEVTRCERCDEELSRTTFEEDALGHDWGAWTTVTEPTEATSGSQARTCSRCGANETRTVPALTHTHDLMVVPAQPASCTAEGHVQFWTCTGCGINFLDPSATQEANYGDLTVPRFDHVPAKAVSEDVVEPTCTEDGSHNSVVRCTHCNAKLQSSPVTDKAKGHTPSEMATETLLEPTCGEGGEGLEHDHIECTTCGETLVDETVLTDATQHNPGEPVRENYMAPTSTTPGSYDSVVYCAICGAELSREHVDVPVATATYVSVSGSGATWDQASADAATGLTFVFEREGDSDATFDHFTGILIDGAKTSRDAYDAASGSVRITLPALLLGTLSEGEHTLTALFDDGNAPTAAFTVVLAKADEGTTSEPTADQTTAADETTGAAAAATASGTIANQPTAKLPKTGDEMANEALAYLTLAGATLLMWVGLKLRHVRG